MKFDKIIIYLALILGISLRIFGQNDESLWLDELNTVEIIKNSNLEILLGSGERSQMPLYFLILKIWTSLFGISEFSLRFPSVIFGTLAILAAYNLTSQLLEFRYSILTAIFMAINPLSIFYSQEARPYSLFLLLGILSYEQLFKLLKSESDFKYYVLFTALAAYTHHYWVFLVVSHLILFFLLNKKITKFSRVFCYLFLFILPSVFFILLTLYRKVVKKIPGLVWFKEPNANDLVSLFTDYYLDNQTGLLVLLVLLGYLFFYRIKFNDLKYFIFSIALSFWFLPLAISYFIVPIFIQRYSIVALILPIILSSLASKQNNLIFLMLLLLNLSPLRFYYFEKNKDLWRQAGNYINNYTTEEHQIVAAPHYTDICLKYYLSRSMFEKLLNSYELSMLKKQIKDYKKLILVTSYDYDPHSEIGKYFASNFKIQKSVNIEEEYGIKTIDHSFKPPIMIYFLESLG